MKTLRTFDLNLLLSLEALLTARNVSHAGTALHLSQSTVSGHLARLRVALHDQLLVPGTTGRGMVLTPRAESIRQQVQDTLVQMRAILGDEQPFDPLTARRTLTVAIVPSDATALAFASFFLPLAKRAAGPDLRIAMRTIAADQIASEMEHGDVDLLVSRQELVPAMLKSKVLMTEPFVLVQRAGHPRGNGEPTLDDFCALEHIVAPGPAGLPSFVDRALAAIGRERRIAVESSDFGVTLDMVVSTDYVAALPASLVEYRAHQVDVFALPFALAPLTLCAAWHARYHHDLAAAWFREQAATAAIELRKGAGNGGFASESARLPLTI